MSEYEYHMGKLKPVKIEKSLKETAIEILKENGYKNFDIDDEDVIWDFQYLCDDYLVINDKIYQIIEALQVDEHGDIFRAKFNEDGTINYEVKFYNGGCNLGEAIETAIERKNNERSKI